MEFQDLCKFFVAASNHRKQRDRDNLLCKLWQHYRSEDCLAMLRLLLPKVRPASFSVLQPSGTKTAAATT
jgi:hypothetical protein